MKEKCVFGLRTVLLTVLCFVLTSNLACPAVALETGSRIHTGEAIIGIGEIYELYQGYSVKMIEPSPAGNKIIMEIDLDGKPVDENIFINKGEVYQYTRQYEDTSYLILSIILDSVDTEDWRAKLLVTQYLDPSRPTSKFFIIDEEKTLEPGVALSLKQDYSLKVEKLDSDSATLALYKQGIKVKEQEMESKDNFTYTISINGREYTVITFKLAFQRSTKNQ